MNVAASIQKEIDINFDEFKSNPSELFILATLSMNKGQYDKAFFILKKSIDLAIDLYGEDNIEVAKYYNKYASAYIQKLLDSDALFMIHLDKEEMSKDGKSLKIIQEEPQCENEIALYNLDIANEMYIDYLDEYDDVSVKKLSKSTIKVYLELADNYLSYGELEQAQSDFKKASEYFKKAAKIREKYDTKIGVKENTKDEDIMYILFRRGHFSRLIPKSQFPSLQSFIHNNKASIEIIQIIE